MPLNVVMHLHDITFLYLTFHIYTILINAAHLFTFTSIYLHRNRKHKSEQNRLYTLEHYIDCMFDANLHF